MEHCNGNDNVYEKAAEMTRKAGLEHLEMPRRCGRKTQRNNVPADSTCQYFERVILYPFVDTFISQLNMRFNTMTRKVKMNQFNQLLTITKMTCRSQSP